ncbi:MAG: chromosome segregation protein SMC, partial [Clostridia bacterium]|nr:chromosome segregation protein SMC [Clostridia bacterium]
ETDQNMQRVGDIEAEIGSRLPSLERDASKARRYLELYGEKKMLDVSLWLYDLKGTRAELEKTETDAEMSAHELEMAEDTARQLDVMIEATDEKRRNNREAFQRTVEEQSEKNRSSSQFENDALRLENNVIRAKERIDSVKERISSALETEKKEEEKAVRLAAEAEKLKEDLVRSKENEDAAAAKRERLITERNEHDVLIDGLFAKRRELEEELSELTVRQSVLKNAVDSQSEQKEELKEQISARRGELEAAGAEADKQSEVVASYEKKSAEEKAALDDVLEKLSDLTERGDAVRRDFNESTASLEAMEERAAAIKRMVEHFDGFNNSVRFVMKASSEGELSGIHGPLSHLVRVDDKYSVAVETAFGNALQNIVTEDEPSAKAAIAALKRESAGRATFYPLTTVKAGPRGADAEAAKSRRGFIGFADDLVSCDAKYRGIVSSVVGKTVVFDTLDNASDMGRSCGWRVRAVTLDGQQINVGGSFTGGSLKRDSGMLTRTGRIEKLNEEIKAEKKNNATLSDELAKINAEISYLTAERLDREEKSRLLDSLFGVEKASLTEAEAKRDFLAEVVSKLEADLLGSDGNREKNEAEIAEAEALIEEKKKEIDALNEERADLAAKRGELDLNAEDAAAELSDSKIETARIEKDLELNGQLINEAKDAAADRRAESADAETEIERLNEEIKLAEEAKIRLREQGEQMDAEAKALDDKLKKLNEESDELEAELSGLRAKEKEQSSKKELLLVANTKNENKLSRLRENIDKMTARLWDEYELTYSSAVELENEEGFEKVDEKNRRAIHSRFVALRDEIKSLGVVNVGAIDEYAAEKERYDGIKRQMDDLTASRAELEKIITSIEEEMKKIFSDAFDKINQSFSEVFRELFGGGNAELSLTDPDDVLNSGIEISAAPPGKTIKHLSLLSGGEQAFIAIALMFALVKFNPSPFCIFDEIESALDEVNVARVANYVKRFSDQIQIIMITHRRGTMEIADTLYGVTMPRHGISKVFTLDVGDESNEKYIK